MGLSCSGCGADSGLSGQASGYWRCQPCLDRDAEDRRARTIERTLRARADLAAGKRRAVLVPGRTLPGPASDEEAEQFALENHGIEWERKPDGSIFTWCEM